MWSVAGLSGPACAAWGGRHMRRWAALATVFLLFATTASTADGAVASLPTKPVPASPSRVGPGTVWILWTGSACETESFGRHHTFTATGNDTGVGNGDQGTYKLGADHGTRVTMTWTAGASAGGVFQGRLSRDNHIYGGPDTVDGDTVTANLDRPSYRGCPVVTSTLATSSTVYGDDDGVTVTVTGTGGVTPTGGVQFWACQDVTGPCDPNGVGATDLGTMTLSGSGDSATALSGFAPSTSGRYCVAALYGGDSHYGSIFDASDDLCFTVTPATSEVTAAPAQTQVPLGGSDTDTATVTGAGRFTPTGTVTFYECGPSSSPSSCTTTTGAEVGAPVNVGSTFGSPPSATATSRAFTPTADGVYCFLALYSGDAGYTAGSDGSTSDQCVTVLLSSTVTATPLTAAIALGQSDSATATVAGEDGVTPTGSVHFFVCEDNPEECAPGSFGFADLGTAPLSGSGATASATIAAYTPPTAGWYCFVATYPGDENYGSAENVPTGASCFTVDSGTQGSPSSGIVALNKVGPHEVLGGGTGQFVVAGDIFLNTDVLGQPWSGSYMDPATGSSWEWDDAIDAKVNSEIDVYGTIDSSNSTYAGEPLWPLDTCFTPAILGDGDPPDPSPAYQSGDPADQLPAEQLSCTEHLSSSTIDYDNISPTASQINDPMQTSDAPPNPMDSTTDIACPGQSLQVDPALSVVGGVTELSPGEYITPVELTGSATLEDCPDGSPGIYRFDDGLWINPQSPADTVTGSNVVIATENPYPIAGNVPGSAVGGAFAASGPGNGAPCLPASTMTSVSSGHGIPMFETSGAAPCGGTSPTTYGVVAYGDSSFEPDLTMSGTGDNFSLLVGGASGSTVTLTGPTSGVYGGPDGRPGLVLYQDPGTQANDGFDAQSGDAATIAVHGVVYNSSLTDYGAHAPLDYWDGVGGGVPFYAGGTLQTGYGTGWYKGPAQSGGSVTLTGTAIVDDFDTDGATTITILGQPYSSPGDSMATAGSKTAASRRAGSAAHRPTRRARAVRAQ